MKSFFPRMNADPAAGGGGGAAAPAGGSAAVVAAGGAAAAPAGGAAAPPPYYSDLIGKDGTLNHESFARVPDSLKSLVPTLASIKTVDDLFGKLHNLNSMAGRKGLVPLAADAEPEDVAAHNTVLRSVLGVPEKPEGYGFTRPADLPVELWDDAQAQNAAKIMHEGNVAPAVAKKLLEMQMQQVRGQVAANLQYEKDFYAAQDAAFRAALQKDGLDYDKTNTAIDNVAKQFGVPLDAAFMKNAAVRMMMHQVGVTIGEGKFVAGEGARGATQSDRALAEDVIHNKTNPDYAIYHDGGHPKNAEVKKRVLAQLENAVRQEQAAHAQAAGRR